MNCSTPGLPVHSILGTYWPGESWLQPRVATTCHSSSKQKLPSMALTIRTRPSLPLNQSVPSGSFCKPLILTQEGRQNENHSHRKLIKLITWTTALSNSMKLWAMPCMAIQDGRVTVKNSDKTRSTGEGNGKPLQYSCLENPMNSMKRQKMILPLGDFNKGRVSFCCYYFLQLNLKLPQKFN